ncbi:hypothetical protein CYMTET_22526 [Cymbomonas tetramitiformis]|uniref:Uncharacterized protein n=1 Tax=Cymbomonas tetramitiformis TaxID=36881 RepID=A0AAE0G021_9CHLO|nr:hypothetical protein CYMTET_22526 [Cymbomonas tetramitiformis]
MAYDSSILYTNTCTNVRKGDCIHFCNRTRRRSHSVTASNHHFQPHPRTCLPLHTAVELLCTEDFASTAGASGPPGLPRSTVEEPSRVPGVSPASAPLPPTAPRAPPQVAAALSEEMRTWTPLRLQLPKVVPPELFGAARGTPFEGTLVRLQGLSNERSKEMVVLRLPDGRLRGWTLGSFGPEDAAYVDTVRPRLRGVPASRPPDAAAVRVAHSEHYAAGEQNCHETEHFAFWQAPPLSGPGSCARRRAPWRRSLHPGAGSLHPGAGSLRDVLLACRNLSIADWWSFRAHPRVRESGTQSLAWIASRLRGPRAAGVLVASCGAGRGRRWGHSLEEGNGKLYGDPHFREMNGRYMEQVWSYFEGQLGVPMPFTSSPPPFLEVSAVLNDWLQERGGELQLVGSKRELFGDRWPGLPTQLAVEYTVGCAGQEAERHTCCVADEEPLELVSVPGVMEVKVVRAEYRPARPKVNVYISNTGLPKHRSGWAFGGRDMMLSPGAMLEGSSVLPHEFGHVMQTHLQGFTLSGGSQPVVGWIWESHANWASHQFVPSYAPVLEWWLARCHYELTSTRHNYGSWLFLQHLLEHSGAPSDFCFRFWQENRKDGRGNSVEDPLQTVMRCGAELGIFPAHDPVGGFGDMIGDMAARMVTMDYTFQRLYLDTALHNPGANGRFPHRTMLQPVPDAAPGGATWRPLYAQLPWQYGINLVELQPEAGAGEAALEFRGLAEGGAADGSGWRVTLVAHDGGACGVLPSQSATAVVTSESAAGTGTPTAVLRVPLRPEHTHMTLAVAACPTQYLPLGFRRGLQLKRAYPYEVHGLCGCRPATPEECWGHGGSGPLPPGGAHANGGGFVASSAHAETTAYVAPGARVLEGARLVGHARAEGHAVVKGRGMVGGHAVVSDWAVVEGEAIVQGNAAVRDFGRVSSRARVEGTARVYDFAAVSGDGTVRGQAVAQLSPAIVNAVAQLSPASVDVLRSLSPALWTPAWRS